MKTKFLILCTGNSARSQIMEGYLKLFGGDLFEVFSAGAAPAERVNPMAIEVMSLDGVDISGGKPEHLKEYLDTGISIVLTVCDHANDVCPVFPGEVERIHISFPDPARAQGGDQEKLAFFTEVRDRIKQATEALVAGYRAGQKFAGVSA